ncbi:MAG: DNA polymerase III subunit tau [Chlamydiales bacterium]|nr:DNA polymerase III subunit tau [Chlamydiales bacterium]
MPEYQVLARKYRPQRFQDVVGQEAIVTTLKNAIDMRRTAHAYLFCGCRGTGKTTLARLFAKALNCKNRSKEGEPCNTCSSCKEIAAGHAIDVLEIDGASHRGIEDIRQINETIGFTPTNGQYKIYLIDEVHMLTKEAFNALLKTLEEPPSHAKFFFATTEPHKIPATILSRCQRFNLSRIPLEKICHTLAAIAQDLELDVKEEALFTIAEMSEGSLRDASSLFDQVIAYQKTPITQEVVSDVLGLPSRDILFLLDKAGSHKDFAAAFQIAHDVFSLGKNLGFFLEELVQHFRTLFLLKNGVPYKGRDQKKYGQAVKLYRDDQLLQILEILTEAQQTMKFAISEKTALEMLLLRIVRTHQRISIDQLVERLVSLEARLDQPVVEPPPKKVSQPAPKPAPKKAAPPPPQPVGVKEQSHFDTLMRFAAKELSGSFKKES